MNYSKLLIFLIVAFSLSLLSCDKEVMETGQLYWVNKQKVDCQGFLPQLCYQVQEGEELGTDWEFFYAPIEGFDEQYEEGFIYQIEVEVSEIENAPQDASSLKYKLIKIISKEG